MLEFKTERSTGRRYLMEINGRLWGLLQRARRRCRRRFSGASSNAPLADKPVAEATGWAAQPLVVGDVDHLLARLRRSDADLAPAGHAVSPSGARDFLRLWRPGD
jgi:hypothetical protein